MTHRPPWTRCADALRHLSTEQIHTHVTHLLSRFDYVLLDAAAAGLHRDVIVLGASVEAVVLVIDASTTRREVAKRTAETLQAARARLFGAVLTNRTFPIPEGIYRRL